MEIEKNIPIPAGWRTRRGPTPGPIRSLVKQMQPSDSILCRNEREYGTAAKAAWSFGYRVCSHRSPIGIRVWRIE